MAYAPFCAPFLFFGGIALGNTNQITFFAGANTPSGFVSLFDGLYDPYGDWVMYIIKGGPGTGKSSFMRKVAAALEKKGLFVERLVCSSDPSSLDAIRIPSIHACIADGTSPHVMEPKFPGAVEEIVNLGAYWDAEQLHADAEEIRRIATVNAALHQRASRFLSAAGAVLDDNRRLLLESVDTGKIRNYASRFAAREFGTPGGHVGLESRRYLSGVTPDGIVIQYGTIAALCPRVIALDDEYGIVSGCLLKLLRSYAVADGYDVITCACPMASAENVEHLLIPELGLCLFTENAFHPAADEPTRRIHARRFMDMSVVKEHRCRLKFNQRAGGELLGEAVSLLYQAKKTHDELESHYVAAMDFTHVDAQAATLTNKLLRRAGLH